MEDCIRNEGRLAPEDALRLFHEASLEDLGMLGTLARELRHGKKAFYVINRHINYTNVCILDCDFCAFGKKRRDPASFELSLSEIRERAEQAAQMGASEIHMVGGLHPVWKFSYYLELLQTLRTAAPGLTIKAFTAIEILHFHRVSRLPVREVLLQLKTAGLQCLTGGGAEIFEPSVREQICRGKETGEEWLMVHRLAHEVGLRSTATMLFGHLETIEHRVGHLEQLRNLQDETGGFLAFLPLAFKPAHRLSHLSEPSPEETLRTIAVSRLFLDNVDHIKAYWISYGLDLAMRALGFGADDLDGTIEEERIYHMAGAATPTVQTAENLIQAIRQAGLQPVKRDALYSREWAEA